MRSKTSFFNKTLFTKNLSRFWPLWGLASFAGAIAPLTLLMQLARLGDVGLSGMDVALAYYSVLQVAIPVISLLYAVLCAAAVWSYLYNPRSTGMIHRLPIRREGLFVTNFVSGMAMMLIPYVITGALTILVTLLVGSPSWSAMGVTVLGVLAESFFYFASATFAAFLTGNVFAMPVLYFLLHFMQPIVSFLLGMLQGGFYYGVPGGYSQALEWLCPTVYLISRVDVNSEYADATGVTPSGEHYLTHELANVSLEKGWLIAVYALVGAVLLALAWALYRKRNSERAGDVAAVAALRPVFRYAGTLLAGIGGGMLLYSLAWRPFQSHYETYETVPLLVCMILMGLIGYYGVSMTLEKSLRVFRKSLPGAALAVVLLAAVVGLIRFDVFGVEKWVPRESELETAECWIEGNDYALHPGDPMLAELLTLHQSIVDNIDQVQQGTDQPEKAGKTYAMTHLDMIYRLTDGRMVRRNYSLCLWEEELAREGSYVWQVDQFVNSATAKQNRLHMNEHVTHRGGDLRDPNYTMDIFLTPDQSEALREAVARDAENGNWGSAYWFEDRLGQEFANMDIWMSVPREGADGRMPGTERNADIYIILRPEMTETIAEMRRLGLLEQDSLTLIDSNGEQADPAYESTTAEAN